MIVNISTLIVLLLIPFNYSLYYSVKTNGKKISLTCIGRKPQGNNTTQLNVSNYTKLNLLYCNTSNKGSLIETFNITGTENIQKLSVEYGGTNRYKHYTSEAFKGFQSLNEVALKYDIQSIERDTFANLSNLKSLLIEGNKLKLDTGVFNNLSNLNRLYLDYNFLNHLEDGMFDSMKNLKGLSLANNNLSTIRKEMFTGLENLEYLDLQVNRIEFVSQDTFSLLPELILLNLASNKINHFSETLLRKNEKLEIFVIDFSRKDIVTLSTPFLSHMPKLTKVYLQQIGLKNISASLFKESTNIERIFLSDNYMRILPENLFQDQYYLEELYLQYNRLTAIPDDLFKTTANIRKISLAFNKIKTLPRKVFDSLENLFELRLNNNRLRKIDKHVFSHTDKLRKLYLKSNCLKSFNINSKSLNNLRFIDMSYNCISKFSSAWKNLALEKLKLHNNSITELSINDLEFGSPQIFIDLTNNNISKMFQRDHNSTQQNCTKSQIIVKLDSNPITCEQVKIAIDSMEPTQNKQITFKINNKICAETIYDPLRILETQFNPFCPTNCRCSVQDENVIVIDCAGNDLTVIPQLSQSLEVNLTFILHVENNSISQLPKLSSPHQTGFSAVIELHARNNSIHDLTTENFPPNLRLLDLSYNTLTILNELVLNVMRHSDELKLRISGNKWLCECSSSEYLHFIQQNHEKISDVDQVSCENGDKLNSITVSDLCKDSIQNVMAICFVVAVIGLVVGLVSALYYKFQLQLKIWLFKHNLLRITEEEIDKDKPYDAFISYSYNDVNFIIKYLLPKLESEPMNFKICWDARDWIPGELIDSQIHRSIENSRRTIIVLSKHFLESVWAQMEFRTAYMKSVADKRARVIVIIYGDIGDIEDLDCELKAYLKLNTYVRWDDRWFWDKLRYAMPHPLRFQDQIRNMELHNM